MGSEVKISNRKEIGTTSRCLNSGLSCLIIFMNIEQLKYHPFSKNIYGDEELPEGFIESIDNHGILVPLVVKKDGTIISGHRRWRAAKALKIRTVPVKIVDYDNELEEREAIIEFNKQREKTFSQKMAEAEEVHLIEKEKAANRRLSVLMRGKRFFSKPWSDQQELGQTRDKVAKAVGIGSGRTYDKAYVVWEAAKKGNTKAREYIEQIDRGELTISGAYTRFKETKTPAQLIVSSNSNEWYTPKKYIKAAKQVMGGIDVDPATCDKANETVGAKKIYTKDDDGLQYDWPGLVWLNPPYGRLVKKFVGKLIEQYEGGITKEAVLLINSHATDTKWFQPLWDYILCFTDHRVNFISPTDDSPAGSTHGSIFVYMGHNKQKFAEVFREFGKVVVVYDHRKSR